MSHLTIDFLNSDEPPEEFGASEVETFGPLWRYDDCDDHINLNSDFNTRHIGPVASSVTNQNFMNAVNSEVRGRPYQEGRDQHLFELHDHHYEAIRSSIKSVTSLINATGKIIGSIIRNTPIMMRSVIFIMGGIASAIGGIASAIGDIASAIGGIASAIGGIASAIGGIASAIGVIGPILLTTLSDLFKLMRSINISSVRFRTARFSTPDRSWKRKKGKKCESKPKQGHNPHWKSKEGHRPRSKPNERNRPSGMASRSATVPKSNPPKLSKWRKNIKTGAGKE